MDRKAVRDGAMMADLRVDAHGSSGAGTGQRVLVVDDEENITYLLSSVLRHSGFTVETAANGREALEVALAFAPDLVLLDVMLPDITGLEVCRRFRADGRQTPVLFLTARDETAEKVEGLAIGDDYVTKPFSLEEVVARVRALLRRTAGPVVASDRYEVEDLVMEDDTHQVWRAGDSVELSPTEYRLLRYLMMNADRVVSKAQILDHVWEYDFGGEGTVVETYISYLRKKIDRGREPIIRTIRGVGYTLRAAG